MTTTMRPSSVSTAQPLPSTAAAEASVAVPGTAPDEAATWMEVVTESETESGQAQVQTRVIDPVTPLAGATGESSSAQQSQSVQNSSTAVVDLDTLD